MHNIKFTIIAILSGWFNVIKYIHVVGHYYRLDLHFPSDC